MRKRNGITGLILAFAFTAFAIPNQSLAQEQATEEATVENLVAALNNTSVEISELDSLDALAAEDVQVVNVEDVLQGENTDSLNSALDRDEVEIVELEEAITANEVISTVLTTHEVDVAVADIVAIDVLSNGGVIVYYRHE